MTSMFVGIFISCSTGLVESDSVGQSGDAPPFALWIQLPNCWSTEFRPLEKGLASWDVVLSLTLYLVFLQNFNAYHTCPEKVMIQHGQIYSKLWLLMCMKYTSQSVLQKESSDPDSPGPREREARTVRLFRKTARPAAAAARPGNVCPSGRCN